MILTEKSAKVAQWGKYIQNHFQRKRAQEYAVIRVDTQRCVWPNECKFSGRITLFRNFIDDFSRFSHVYIIKHRSEVLDKFKEFIELTENLTGY